MSKDIGLLKNGGKAEIFWEKGDTPKFVSLVLMNETDKRQC